MFITYSQYISLISYGNEYLATGTTMHDFYPGNSSFLFCKKVDFKKLKRKLLASSFKEEPIAEGPQEWFSLLRNENCRKLRLYIPSSMPSISQSVRRFDNYHWGAGNWFIEAVYDDHSSYWQSRWTNSTHISATRRDWTVSYGRAIQSDKTANARKNPDNAAAELEKILVLTSLFTERIGLNYWSATFRGALKTLNNSTPGIGYSFYDMAVLNNYSLRSLQLLYAASAAWVFGGRDSWSDLGFDDKGDTMIYNDLSGKLYTAVNNGIEAAINSF